MYRREKINEWDIIDESKLILRYYDKSITSVFGQVQIETVNKNILPQSNPDAFMDFYSRGHYGIHDI